MPTQRQIKILGVEHDVGKEKTNNTGPENEKLENMISTISRRIISFRAEAINLDIFVYSKLVYVLRHTKLILNQLNGFQKKISKSIWLNKRAAVSSDILCLPARSGGIGLPNIKVKVLAAMVVDVKNIFFNTAVQKLNLVQQMQQEEKGCFQDLKKSSSKQP